MDSLTPYRHTIEQVLQDYADFLQSDDSVQIELVFDRERDRYLLVETYTHLRFRSQSTSDRSLQISTK
ncbi:MAG: element excision factor XisI family protein [Scytonema sp. PMC 1069.18]|nr:element excision factor XisI family protein [Scytonema sp. PMC 1069.18]MEC4881974.1 element excision factor XisI family protein [Scytonema sp. PMC 1070.18]